MKMMAMMMTISYNGGDGAVDDDDDDMIGNDLDGRLWLKMMTKDSNNEYDGAAWVDLTDDEE